MRRYVRWGRVSFGFALLVLSHSTARAAGATPGTVKGTVAIRDVAEPSAENQGFWRRQALLVRPAPYDPRPEVVVVLEGGTAGADATAAPSTRPVLELTGERFWPPVLPVVTGWE